MNKHLKNILVAAGLLALGVTSASAAALSIGSYRGIVGVGAGAGDNAYYLNNNFDSNGNATFGVLGVATTGGPIAVDGNTANTPAIADYYNNGTDGSKSAVQIGSYVFFTGDNAQGVRRVDSDWTTDVTGYQLAAISESVTTDGSKLITNVDNDRDVVRSYTIANSVGSFTATQAWEANLNNGGRVRGVSYSPNGYVYVSTGGAGSDRSIFGIDATNGSFTDFGVDVPGSTAVYNVIRYVDSGSGQSFLIANDVSNIYIWDMTGNLSVNNSSLATYTGASLGLGGIYGISARDGVLFVGNDTALTTFNLTAVPEPSTYAMMAMGLVMSAYGLKISRRKKQSANKA